MHNKYRQDPLFLVGWVQFGAQQKQTRENLEAKSGFQSSFCIWTCPSGLCLWHLQLQRVVSLLITHNLLQHVALPWLALISQCFDFLAQSNTVKLELGQI